MLFNSIQFFAFYAVFFPTYWLVHKHVRIRNTYLLVGSYFFYANWDWRFLGLIALSTVVDYLCGRHIHTASKQSTKKALLITSLTVNLGALGIFKYFDFFVTEMVTLLTALGVQSNLGTLNIILPVGISFYTFQTLSYTLDIYYGRMQPTKSLLNFAAFVAYFPQLVAGPIERARALLPQIESQVTFRFVQLRDGACLILWGLAKKVLIADRLAVYVDAVFADPSSATGPQSAIAIIFFAIQIYCDFSGYSDIARGLAKTMGINLMVNFNSPYFATSIQEFWQRWHISLSTWFRDYLYIPLGGSRAGTLKKNRNILTTFTVSGLWHGANWTFIIWGMINAVGHLIDPFSRQRDSDSRTTKVLRVACGWFLTMLFINLSWAFFRADTLADAATMLANVALVPQEVLAGLSRADIVVAMNNTEFAISLYLIGLLFLADFFNKDRGFDHVLADAPTAVRWLLSWVVLVHFLLLPPSDSGAFIYFQF